MPKKKDFREALIKRLPKVLNAVFEQGKAAQRMEDASFDFQTESHIAEKELSEFMSILNTPEKKELN